MMRIIPLYIFMLLLCAACNSHRAGTAPPSITPKTSDTLSAPAAQQDRQQEQIAEIYSKAVAEYIKAVSKKDKPLPDTLFILKHADFPDIILPSTIQQANIRLLTTEEAEKKLRHSIASISLNVIGWIDKDHASFIIVTFFDDFRPQHNCRLSFIRNTEQKEFVLDKLFFEYPYGK